MKCSSVDKGNLLEDALYEYLCAQKERGALVFGAYPPGCCKIYKKKNYFGLGRKRDVNFDVVIELFRERADTPHLYIIFECKNHRQPVKDIYIREFSHKLNEIFTHNSKGVIVTSSGLQTGAEATALDCRLGIVKYDDNGFEVVAERKGWSWTEQAHIKSQIFGRSKPLKFSGYHDGRFFGSVDKFIQSLDPDMQNESQAEAESPVVQVEFLPTKQLKEAAIGLLKLINYRSGPVDLEPICSLLEIDVSRSDVAMVSEDGESVLGSANFLDRAITIYKNGNNIGRERFTLAHEIGHLHLDHAQYLFSERVFERDLFTIGAAEVSFNYERLEYQANAFAAELLLPEDVFREVVSSARLLYDIQERTHGYIFVDDQPCNLVPYIRLLALVAEFFKVSKRAVELRLNKLGLLNDQRYKAAKMLI